METVTFVPPVEAFVRKREDRTIHWRLILSAAIPREISCKIVPSIGKRADKVEITGKYANTGRSKVGGEVFPTGKREISTRKICGNTESTSRDMIITGTRRTQRDSM